MSMKLTAENYRDNTLYPFKAFWIDTEGKEHIGYAMAKSAFGKSWTIIDNPVYVKESPEVAL